MKKQLKHRPISSVTQFPLLHHRESTLCDVTGGSTCSQTLVVRCQRISLTSFSAYMLQPGGLSLCKQGGKLGSGSCRLCMKNRKSCDIHTVFEGNELESSTDALAAQKRTCETSCTSHACKNRCQFMRLTSSVNSSEGHQAKNRCQEDASNN